MKKLFIVANWKSNKTSAETENWFQRVSSIEYGVSSMEDKKIIICPGFTSLPAAKYSILNTQPRLNRGQYSIHLGAQDLSPFPAGAYTGEVNGVQVKELADYVIIGHSERRQHFGENDEILGQKVEQSLSVGLDPIFCVQGKETSIPQGVTMVAYEPVFAIGSGTPDTPENANSVAGEIRKQHPDVTAVLYGGSVTGENVHSFTRMEYIDGVLVGGASLDTEKFIKIIQNA